VRDDYRMDNVVRKAVLLSRRPLKERVMAQYLVAIHLPDDFDPSSIDKAMEHDIDIRNEEIKDTV
jgi:hypothetical protein